jgi:hypothetical protein
MTYEQKYGRLPDGLADLETPPEDWQFENAKPVKITGRKPLEVPKLNLAAILPKPKEAIEVKFQELDLDKQAKMVDEEYNKDVSINGMCKKFGIGPGPLYKHIHAAKDAGFIPIMRSERKATPEPQVGVLERASVIATDLTELLGDEAGDLINSLYVRVS